MPFKLQPSGDHLRIEVKQRAGADEVREMVEAAMQAVAGGAPPRVLILVTRSDPIFRVDQYGLEELLDRAAAMEGLRIAMVSDSKELFASHQYLQLLAAQRGVNIRSFREEAEASEWLMQDLPEP